MIKIDDTWSISSDRYNFIVVETYTGKKKDGTPKKQTHKTFHPNLEQCLNYIRRQDCKNAETVEELFKALEKSYKLDSDSALRSVNNLTRASISQSDKASRVMQ